MSSVTNLIKFLHLYIELKYHKIMSVDTPLNTLLQNGLGINEEILTNMPEQTVGMIVKNLDDLCSKLKKMELEREKLYFLSTHVEFLQEASKLQKTIKIEQFSKNAVEQTIKTHINTYVLEHAANKAVQAQINSKKAASEAKQAKILSKEAKEAKIKLDKIVEEQNIKLEQAKKKLEEVKGTVEEQNAQSVLLSVEKKLSNALKNASIAQELVKQSEKDAKDKNDAAIEAIKDVVIAKSISKKSKAEQLALENQNIKLKEEQEQFEKSEMENQLQKALKKAKLLESQIESQNNANKEEAEIEAREAAVKKAHEEAGDVANAIARQKQKDDAAEAATRARDALAIREASQQKPSIFDDTDDENPDETPDENPDENPGQIPDENPDENEVPDEDETPDENDENEVPDEDETPDENDENEVPDEDETPDENGENEVPDEDGDIPADIKIAAKIAVCGYCKKFEKIPTSWKKIKIEKVNGHDILKGTPYTKNGSKMCPGAEVFGTDCSTSKGIYQCKSTWGEDGWDGTKAWGTHIACGKHISELQAEYNKVKDMDSNSPEVEKFFEHAHGLGGTTNTCSKLQNLAQIKEMLG